MNIASHSNDTHERSLKSLLTSDARSMDILKTARELQMPDWAIGAGFIRTLVWDHISHKNSTPLDDVDVLFFEASNLSKNTEKEFELQLMKMRPDIPWSVKNQARMHIRNKTKVASNTTDAMRYWLETPTAVAARIDANDEITILAPFGLDDLFKMIIRPTPAATSKMEQFEARLTTKFWLKNWPELKIIRP